MPEPIIQTRPNTEQAVVNKYQQNPGLLSNAPNAVQRALLQLDVERAAKGQNPLSIPQTVNSLKAIETGRAVTPARKSNNILKNFASDVKEITTSIPKLPVALYHEVLNLPDAPAAIGTALSQGNPLDIISGIAKAPGIRMLPGAFIAGNINNPGELLRHPLYTALDVLPAKEIPVVAKSLTKAGEVVRASPAAGMLRSTRPAQIVKEMVGRTSRDAAQMSSEADTVLRDQMFTTKDGLPDPELTSLYRQADQVHKTYEPHIPVERRQELTNLVQHNPELIPSLNGPELAFANETRRVTDAIGDYAVSQDLLAKIDGEVYDLRTAGKILSARRVAEATRTYSDIRGHIESPSLTPDELLNRAEAVLARTDLKVSEQRKLIEGYAYSIESTGHDASTLLSGIKASRNTRNVPVDGVPALLRDSITAQRGNIIEVGSEALTQRVLASLEGLTPKSSKWTDIKSALKSAGRDTTDVDTIIAHERRINAGKQYVSKFGASEKAAERAAKLANRTSNSNAPARFQPMIRDKFDALAKAKLSDRPDFATLLPYLSERNYSYLRDHQIFSSAELRQLELEATQTWKELKDQGFDPIFVHSVSPGSEFVLKYPKVLESLRAPSSTKKRLFDATPALNDISISLPHMAMEYLGRKGSERFVEQFSESFGRIESDVLQDYLPSARDRFTRDKSTSIMGHAKKLMDKEWVEFDPVKLIDYAPTKLQQLNPHPTVLIPRSLANNLRRTHVPPAGRLTGVIDPVMGAFRTSLLPLSLRWHVYNILSGAMLITTTAGPQVWSKLSTAYDMVKNDAMPAHMPKGMGSVPRETLEWSKRSSEQASALFQHSAGKSLRKIYNAVQPARDAFGKVVEKSYNFNGFIDDMYRSMAYLQGHDTALTKGMSRAAAEEAGITLGRKTMQNWDRMTPIERTIMRYVFPFYGWMSFIMRYVTRYPIDNPIRASIMGSFGRNEIADHGDALPTRFLNTFFLGHQDENGNQTGLNLAGLNPFADVSNYFTLAGFMGQTNPIITSLLESVGVDPQSGGPELFPNLRYDPESGRLAVAGKNPLKLLAQNTVPQTRILSALLDGSSEYKALLRTNPSAANRMLLSSAGIPLLFRDINVPQEIAKNEVARSDNQKKVLNNALKTGNWKEANTYPQLIPVLNHISEMQSAGAFDNMQAGIPSPTDPTKSVGQNKIAQAQQDLIHSLVPFR
jgi:hypothetical protein